jgi:O-antigen ligase
MTERDGEIQPQISVARRVLRVVTVALYFLVLGGVGIGLGLFLGKRISEGEWPILITLSGLAVYVSVALINARHALLFWMATAPFSRFIYLDLELGKGIPNFTLSRVMTGTLLLLLVAQLATRRRELVKMTWVDAFLLVFCGTLALSIPAARMGFKTTIQSFFDLILVPAILYFLTRNMIRSYRDFESVMYTLLVIGVYMGFLATWEQLTGTTWFYPENRSVYYTRHIRRVVSLLGNPAYIALVLNMGIPFVWYLFLEAEQHRLLLLGSVGLMMAGVFFCMNRAGWVGLLCALIVMGMFVKKFWRVFVVMVVMGVIVASAYWAVIVTSPAVQERLQASGPIAFRKEAWRVGLLMARDNLWFGVGFENYHFYYRQYGRWDIYLRAAPSPHNTFLWVLLTGGMVALVPFVAFVGSIVYKPLRLYLVSWGEEEGSEMSDLAGVFLASMASILVPGLVMDLPAGNYHMMLWFFVMGAYFGAAQGERRRTNQRHLRQSLHLERI